MWASMYIDKGIGVVVWCGRVCTLIRVLVWWCGVGEYVH